MTTRTLLAALTLEVAAAATLAAGATAPTPARAQVSVQIAIQVPVPPAPALLFAAPGVQVVADWPDEVFYVSGGYWVRRDGGWYHAASPRARFFLAQPGLVPSALERLPPGHYRHWQRAQAHAAKEAWKAEKARARAEKKAWQQARSGRENGHGNGHGNGHDD
jgi:hypothetical protein